jgi:glucokinase
MTACFAVAGPVKDNVVRFTNRASWSIDGDLIAEELGIEKVLLINDFLAVGYGLLTLDEVTECILLQVHNKPYQYVNYTLKKEEKTEKIYFFLH